MKHRTLGKSGILVSPLGLGCWAIGGLSFRGGTPTGWGESDDSESIKAIRAGIDAGVNFFDTADCYGAGHSERVIAEAIKGRRDKVVLATKFGYRFDEATRTLGECDWSHDYICAAVHDSLVRLNTDVIDVLYLHIKEVPAAGEVRDLLERLVVQGKIRAYGWSTDSLRDAAIFAEGPHCAAIQHHMNVLAGDDSLVSFCELRGLASVNRGPLHMGILTGKYSKEHIFDQNDIRRAWINDNTRMIKRFEAAEAVKEILKSNGRTLAQGALCWLWARSNAAIPIPGFRTVAQVEENAGAMAFGALPDHSMHEIKLLLSSFTDRGV